MKILFCVCTLLLLLLLTSCDGFTSASVPMVEAGKGAQPITEGEYRLMLPEAKEAILTGLVLKPVGDHYVASFASQCKLQLSLEALGNLQPDDAGEIDKFTKESDAQIARGIASMLDITEYFAPLGMEADPVLPAAYRGFVLAPLAGSYYIQQTPLTFPVEQWPATKDRPKPSWNFKVVKVGEGSVEFYGSEAASVEASKALFGTTRSCDAQGKCSDVAKVAKFTDTAEVNRQIAVRAVREFSSKLVLQSRLEKVSR
ncbi:hypothetical protein F183_A07570 [Bryobacterales bacterium F-183]|nr:hypothetical protein F183_A07570 [Bryobacterales bacterium F-183]